MTSQTSNSFSVSIVSAQLTYLNSLAPYQVLSLATPTNGVSTVNAATPTEWKTSSGVGTMSGWINAWSGGAGDPATNKLYMLGGGHGDSANNGIYCFDFNGTSQPTGFSVLSGSLSAVADVPHGGLAYDEYPADGKMSSRHIYDGCCMIGGSVYQFGGGAWQANYAHSAYRFIEGSPGVWQARAAMPTLGGSAPWSCYDPTSNKVLYYESSAVNYCFYNVGANTWSSPKAMPGGSLGLSYTTLMQQPYGRVIAFGAGVYFNVDWASDTITSRSTFTESSILTSSGLSVLWDAPRNCFWVFGGEYSYLSDIGYSTIFEVNPTTFAVIPHTLSASIAHNTQHTSGKRCVLIGNGAAIGFAASISSPAVVIKLP